MTDNIDKSSFHLDKSRFIENGANASYFQWLYSRGTNYTCYENYVNGLSEQDIINRKIENTRIIVYALQRPITIIFFYWTMLVFILHKFNFRKPIMKLILFHYVF
eukprot:jgi/Orpsp1_1/1177003/evm.model.c7180000059787.1